MNYYQQRNRSWHLCVEWKVEDFWIGLFWRRDGNCFDLWICLLPCVPIHFSCWGEKWGMREAVHTDATSVIESRALKTKVQK